MLSFIRIQLCGEFGSFGDRRVDYGAIWTNRDSQGLQNHTRGKVSPYLRPKPILPHSFPV